MLLTVWLSANELKLDITGMVKNNIIEWNVAGNHDMWNTFPSLSVLSIGMQVLAMCVCN